MNYPQTFAASLAAALAQAVAAGPELLVGEPFPGIVLPSMTDGRPMSLADFRGRKVILQVFASW